MNDLRQRAEGLRSKGLSYSEISSKIGVSKSTLSGWLSGFEISKKAKDRLKTIQQKGRNKGGLSRKNKVRKDIARYDKEALDIVSRITKRELLLIGSILHWCEGAKQSEKNISIPVRFGNTDPSMIKLFLTWLEKCLNVKICPKTVSLTLYLHPGANEKAITEFWLAQTGLNSSFLRKPVYKKKRLDDDRKSGYHGLARIEIAKSADLNRRIAAIYKAISKIVLDCGVV